MAAQGTHAPLQEAVTRRIERELDRLGASWQPSLLVERAVRNALLDPELSDDECRLLSHAGETPAGALLDAALALRVQSALAAGLRVAIGELELDVLATPPPVRVLRRYVEESAEEFERRRYTLRGELAERPHDGPEFILGTGGASPPWVLVESDILAKRWNDELGDDVEVESVSGQVHPMRANLRERIEAVERVEAARRQGELERREAEELRLARERVRKAEAEAGRAPLAARAKPAPAAPQRAKAAAPAKAATATREAAPAPKAEPAAAAPKKRNLWPLLVPLLLAAAGLYLWLGRDRGESAPRFVAASSTIHLGPDHTSERIDLRPVGAVSATERPAVRLLDSRGNESPDFEIVWVTGDAVEVRLRDDPSPGLLRTRATIDLGGQAAKTAADGTATLELVWLGTESWRVSTIDTEGDALVVRVQGEGAQSVRSARIETDEGEFALARTETADETVVFRGGLATSGELVLEDASGSIRRRLVSVGTVGEPLALLEPLRLVEDTDDSSPKLELFVSQAVPITHWFEVDGARVGQRTTSEPADAGSRVELVLDPLAALGPRPADATVVVEAEGEVLGRVPLAWRPLPEEARLELFDPRTGAPFDRGAPTRLAEPRIAVELRRGATPLDVSVRGARGADSLTALAAQDTRSAAATLELDGDGPHTIELLAVPVGFDAKVHGFATELDVVVDTSAPTALWEKSFDQPEVLSSGESFAHLARADEADVEFDWGLAPQGGGDPVAQGVTAPGSKIEIPVELSDGEYQLRLRPRDSLRNTGVAIERSLELARQGPRIEILEPRSDGTWEAASHPATFSLRVRAEDPNGLRAGAEATLLAASEDEVGLAVLLQPGTTDDIVLETAELSAELTLTEHWSRREIYVAATVLDVHGNTSRVVVGPFTMPEIEPELPELAAELDGRTVAPMRLVRGNTNGPYVFGGRSDNTENSLFEDAGLPPFNSELETLRSRAWRITFSTGEIADYYLDEREVTCAEFLEFIDAGIDGYLDARLWPAGSSAPDESRRVALSRALAARPDDVPATDVTWEEASAYAAWVGKRLPSWVEFEYASRGGTSYRPYASWSAGVREGDVAGLVNAAAPVEASLLPAIELVDRTPDTQIFGLTGNASEWTRTPVWFEHGPAPRELPRAHARDHRLALLDPDWFSGWASLPEFWVAGGNVLGTRFDFSAADARPRHFHSPVVGFRCAISLDEYRSGGIPRPAPLEESR